MSIVDRLRGKGKAPPPDRTALELPAVMGALAANLTTLEKKRIQPLLVRARLADWLRDAASEPPGPELVDEWVADLDLEGWRRLALLVAALEAEAVGAVVARLTAHKDAGWLVKVGLVGTAAGTPLHTLALLRESTVRLEELARVWLAALGAAVDGETAAQSAKRLRRIDYNRLLGEAERARQAAEGRMAELRKEQAEKARAGRSKW